MNCPQCNQPLPPGATVCERCPSAPFPVPFPATLIQGRVELEQQVGGMAEGVGIHDSLFTGPVTFTGNVVLPPPPSPDAQATERWFHVPSPNGVFTGRERELEDLYEELHPGIAARTPMPCALQGMGGVGKSQVALAYVHQHGYEYHWVFWVVGASPAQLTSELARLATDLSLDVPAQADENTQFQAVQAWFGTHANWLLVVDNAEQLPHLKPLLPQHPTGRILLTTRETVPASFAKCIPVEHMDDEMGALLLLRRAGRLAAGATLDTADTQIQAEAQEVSRELGGLALALDQAGAYMQQRALSPATYLRFYRQRYQDLHRDYDNSDHASVTVTFIMALEQVEQIPYFGAAAAELARMCAFLAPDSIPDEIFTLGASEISETLAPFAADEIEFADVCEAVTRYALLRRETDPPGLTMHRLAQEVLRDGLSVEERQITALRSVFAMNIIFPEPNFPTWNLCARLLPHAFACTRYITEFTLHAPQSARLLDHVARYLHHHARYTEAEPLFVKALSIRRQIHGQHHREVAVALNNLGLMYRDLGRYPEAALHLQEVVDINRRLGEEDTPDYATALDNLGGVYYFQGQFDETTTLWEQALDITQRTRGQQHSDVAFRLGNLGNVYIETGRYVEAQASLLRAIAIDNENIGVNLPGDATHLMNLAGLYVRCNLPDAAELPLQCALSIYEQIDYVQHPSVAHCHYWFGRVRCMQGNLTAASEYFAYAWEVWEHTLGVHNHHTIDARSWLKGVQRELSGQGS